MTHLKYHPGAAKDVRESFTWYAHDSPETALRFIDSVENAYATIVAHPKRFPSFSRNTRKLTLQDFPFSIVYRELPTAIHIIAVAHAKRRPGYWSRRL